MRLRPFNLIIILILAVSAMSCDSGEPVRSFEPAVGGRPVYNAVCYGPHRDGQRPGGNQPSAGELLEDLRLMEPHWKLIRIYNSSEYTETFLRVIRDNGIDVKVMLGVWIDPEEKRDEGGQVLERFEEAAAANRIEVEAGIRLANAYPDIVAAVCVGNETQIFWSAHRSPLDILIGHVRTVREGVEVPVANTVRLSILAIALWSMVLWRKEARLIAGYTRGQGLRTLGIVVLTGIIGMSLGTFAYLAAVQLAGAARTSVLTAAMPMFGVPFSLFLGEKLTTRIVVGTLLTIGGVWLTI